MSNVIRLPKASTALHPTHVAAEFLERPATGSHAVQFFDEDAFLFDAVGKFLAAGLDAGEHLVVVATKVHQEGFVARLGTTRVSETVHNGQLLFLDANELLARFMVNGSPDPDLFRHVLDGVFGPLSTKHVPIRVYGEMVDVLWREGNRVAAIRLEELWNEAGRSHSFSLLCAYVMGNFYRAGDSAEFFEVCRNHSHVIPAESFGRVDDAEVRLREISLLQQRARSLESEIAERKQLEVALREALHERGEAERRLRASLEREKAERVRAEETTTFRELFLGMLGHDLRNPLNTILMTTQLMVMRGEVPAESKPRLDRVIAAGLRMQRMITQILDMTRARLADGISIAPRPVDLAPLVAKIVDEIQAAHPAHVIDLRAEASLAANVDADRLEQVIGNLVGNAVTHGDTTKPVTVTLETDPQCISLRVHNHGTPIPAEVVSSLFDPFARGNGRRSLSDGLGLGLYISERIVSAHGGVIRVTSSRETGTLFEVTLPQRSP